jgi:hypothetical protein
METGKNISPRSPFLSPSTCRFVPSSGNREKEDLMYSKMPEKICYEFETQTPYKKMSCSSSAQEWVMMMLMMMFF